MIITKETKERFVKMLRDRQIIIIQCDKGRNRKTYDFKIIGANSGGRWDFTPLVAETSIYPSSRGETIQKLSVRGLDGAAVVANTIFKLEIEGIKTNFGEDYYGIYQNVRELLTTFYI